MMNYDLLPEHMRGSMKRYIEDKISPGGFLTAVLENNLVKALGRADYINKDKIYDIVAFLYTEAPSQCWGSPEKVNKWLVWEEEQNDIEEKEIP